MVGGDYDGDGGDGTVTALKNESIRASAFECANARTKHLRGSSVRLKYLYRLSSAAILQFRKRDSRVRILGM